ncbi:Disintegrin and metalloproteinase domain-containing protein 10, partial [Pseudolycoriella hygida]
KEQQKNDENALVHGILTTANLFDGTITTKFEHYYIEPLSKYSNDLHGNGVHSIVYKASDVVQPMQENREIRHKYTDLAEKSDYHCACDSLHRNMKKNIYKKQKPASSASNIHILRKKIRKRRFLPDELIENQNPPLPLDLDVPYNDDYSPNHDEDANSEDVALLNSKNHLNRKNILFNDFSSNSDLNLRDTQRNRNNMINNLDIVNISRPSHKTHVEIITKNGATKKPHIIVNNYNPDVMLTSTSFHQNLIHQHVRNDLPESTSKSSYDRKTTCMLYLQADHTFSQKMGSDEASIEAITRHVQRANFIYKHTDFNGDGKPDNITFMIKRIKVHNLNALKDPTYRFPGNYGVEKFLELFSADLPLFFPFREKKALDDDSLLSGCLMS